GRRRLPPGGTRARIFACGSWLQPKRIVALPMMSLSTASPWSSSGPEPAPGWTPRSRLTTPRVRHARPRPSAARPDRAREVECRGFRSIEVDAQQTCGSLPVARLHLLEDLAVRVGPVRVVLAGFGRAGERRRQPGHEVEVELVEQRGTEQTDDGPVEAGRM